MHVTPADVLAYMAGDGAGTSTEQLYRHIETTTAMVRAYTRDRGFEDPFGPADDLAGVIVSCTARQVGNPAHTISVGIDDATVRHGMFLGWTLPELAILHRYRVRAQ